ncbi:MAG: GyrI-like domain-containing protein [Candidatus Riflebacteria bacterium]|nr:GyrI-like domain-containing protein [Candidatus Riflebacteria bacterium]
MKKVWIVLAVLALCCGSLMALEKAPTIKAEIREIAPFTYMCHEGKGPYIGIPAVEKAFLADFSASGLKAADKEITLYWNSPFYVKPVNLLWDIGYPVSGDQKDMPRLKAKKFMYKKVAVALHVGSYATTYITINALYEWIPKNGYKTIGGPCVERYLDDPDSTVPDAQKKTEIWIPIY